jgi:hypothetical protein
MAIWADRVVRTPGPPPTVQVYPSRRRLGGLALGTAVFTAFGVVMATADGLGALLLGGTVALLFALSTAALLGLAFAENPVLVLDERGITNRTSASGPRFLAWEQITMVFPQRRGPGPSWIAVERAATGQHGRRATMRVHTATLPLSVDAMLQEIAAAAPERVWVDAPEAHR